MASARPRFCPGSGQWEFHPAPAAHSQGEPRALLSVLDDDRFPHLMRRIRKYLRKELAQVGPRLVVRGGAGGYSLCSGGQSDAAYVDGVESLRVSCRRLHAQIFASWALGISFSRNYSPVELRPLVDAPTRFTILGPSRRSEQPNVLAVCGAALLLQPPSHTLRCRALRALRINALDRLGFLRLALLAGHRAARPPSGGFVNRACYSLLPSLLNEAQQLHSLALTLPAPAGRTRMPADFISLPLLQHLQLEISAQDLAPGCYTPEDREGEQDEAAGKAERRLLVIGSGAIRCPALHTVEISSPAARLVDIESGALPPSVQVLSLRNVWPEALLHMASVRTLKVATTGRACALPDPIALDCLPPALTTLEVVAPGASLRLDPALPASITSITLRAEQEDQAGPQGDVEILDGRFPDDLGLLDMRSLGRSIPPRALPAYLVKLHLKLRHPGRLIAGMLPVHLRQLFLHMDPADPHQLPPLPQLLESLTLVQVPRTALDVSTLPPNLLTLEVDAAFKFSQHDAAALSRRCSLLKTVTFDTGERYSQRTGRDIRSWDWPVEGVSALPGSAYKMYVEDGPEIYDRNETITGDYYEVRYRESVEKTFYTAFTVYLKQRAGAGVI